MMNETRELSIAADLYGCPNRCLHCWLSHMPNHTMEEGADQWIVDRFRPYFDSIAFYSWLRELDFCPDYRTRWARDLKISVNAVPERFELGSFTRLSRDPDYAAFLWECGVRTVQLTFFGAEETTDRYVGRKGAYRELLRATEVLLAHGISPRWQSFIDEENKDELPGLLRLSEELELSRRSEAFGGAFRFFVHPGTCDGENRKRYPVRIIKEHVPAELIPYFLNYDALFSEKALCRRWADDASCFVPHNEGSIVLYVANNYDLFFNFTHMRPEWRIGNLKTEPMEELVRRVREEDIWALREARKITLSELVRRYGDPDSERAFEEDDYRMYLLNTHLERTFTES